MTKSKGILPPKGTRTRWVAEQQGLHLCHCGCNQPVQLQPVHYPNAPQFIHGHNAALRKQPPKATTPCQCGCGELATPGRRFISGHNAKGRYYSPETRKKMR